MMNKKGRSFEKTFYIFIFFALVILGLLNSTFTIQTDNVATNKLADNELFSDTASRLSSNFTGSEDDSKIQQGIFSDETPKSGFGSIVLFGIVSAGKTFTDMTYGFFNLVIKIPMVVLGIESEIVSAFMTVLIVSLIIGVWIVYKLGG